MERDLQKLFKQAVYQPESRLSGDIWRVIETKEKRASTIKSFSYGFVGIISFALLVPMVGNLITQLSQSGFYQYVSLAFSDIGSISLYWKEFMASVVETIPTTSLILVLSLLFIFLTSSRRAFTIFKSPLLTV